MRAQKKVRAVLLLRIIRSPGANIACLFLTVVDRHWTDCSYRNLTLDSLSGKTLLVFVSYRTVVSVLEPAPHSGRVGVRAALSNIAYI